MSSQKPPPPPLLPQKGLVKSGKYRKKTDGYVDDSYLNYNLLSMLNSAVWFVDSSLGTVTKSKVLDRGCIVLASIMAPT